MEIKKSNPECVAPPIGSYHHIVVIPRNAELVVLSGQIGCDQNGNIPEEIETQFSLALENIQALLASEGMDASHVFKVNIWLTEEISRDTFVEAWRRFHNDSPPATTLGYVTRLAKPELKVEVEAWTAR